MVGASEDTNILRGRCCATILHHRFDGSFHLVSRSVDSVFGHKVCRRITDLPVVPDLAFLMTPAAATPEALRECATFGIPAVIVVGSGFAEEGSPAGWALQDEIAGIAQAHDMALCGPNSEGFADLRRGLALTFSPVLGDFDPLPESLPRKGARIAIVAQSGAIGFGLFDLAWTLGLNVERIVTTGNEAVLDLADYLGFLAEDGATDAVLVFAEGFRDGRRLLAALARCREAGVPVVMLRAGRSELGQRQAASHTGALAGDDRMIADLLTGAGVIDAAEPGEAVEIVGLVAAMKAKPVMGRRIGVYSATGGGAGLLADLCERDGLGLPEFQPETRATLDAVLPSYGTSSNPVDTTATGIHALGYAELTMTLAADPGIDAVIVAASGRSATSIGKDARALKELAQTCDKPVVFWSYTTPIEAFGDIMDEAGIPYCGSPGVVTKALAGLARLTELSARPQAETHALPDLPVGLSTESVVYPLLESLGLHVGTWELTHSPEEAARVAAAIGHPVALKIQSLDIPHKTEAGGVCLDVLPQEAAEACAAMLEKVTKSLPEAAIDGVLVQAMAPHGVEMMLGAVHDPSFGPVVLIGRGGIHAEVLRDVAFAEAPLSQSTARAMIERLWIRPLLDGARGAAPVDVAALARAVVAVSQLAGARGFRELDLNPVMVHEQGLTVVDALLIAEGG
ncbi:MAG: acetate--CoA ligase family protein [Alphaproteobacteria bacterium]|nr:acetate--CoA ligase family protein [Rhodospirillaceae bacterium]MDG2483340.1 acetate--CoA ligase family protein [Alphaproteobacteria bacterium]